MKNVYWIKLGLIFVRIFNTSITRRKKRCIILWWFEKFQRLEVLHLSMEVDVTVFSAKTDACLVNTRILFPRQWVKCVRYVSREVLFFLVFFNFQINLVCFSVGTSSPCSAYLMFVSSSLCTALHNRWMCKKKDLIRSVLGASKFSVLKFIEIVILWVYYTIPFGFSLFRHFRTIICIF